MALSFIKDFKTVAAPTKTGAGADPVSRARHKMMAAITDQLALAKLQAEGRDLPKSAKGRAPRIWWQQFGGNYLVSLRHGTIPIILDEEGKHSHVSASSLEDVAKFLQAASRAIAEGELDPILSEMLANRPRRGRGVARRAVTPIAKKKPTRKPRNPNAKKPGPKPRATVA